MKLPVHLSNRQALGFHPGEPIAQFEIGKYKNFVYLILDWTQKKAAFVDPQYEVSEPLECLKQNGFQLSHILLTHTHFDHIAGVPELVRLHPDVPVMVHRDDLHRLDDRVQSHGKIQLVRDGDIISVGQLTAKVLHTPGHSSGECCYLVDTQPPYLLTGDTLFIRDCGRTDLETGSNEQMFHSLQRIKKLPPETIILPGHHYREECASTLERELKTSPPLQCGSISELAALP